MMAQQNVVLLTFFVGKAFFASEYFYYSMFNKCLSYELFFEKNGLKVIPIAVYINPQSILYF
jgi:hypothetical protein